jgi:release factor glutamine methyltransferase
MHLRIIQELLGSARTALSNLSDSPRLDAELLLTGILDCQRSHLHAYPDAVLTKSQAQQYRSWIERRAQGEPLAYILGVKEFWSLPLRVTPDALVPRPETEMLIELALERIPKCGTLKILDLGTGSGAIALAIAKERPNFLITATDISQAALNLAIDNANRLALKNIKFLTGDWLVPLDGHFHLIVSNPPYVDADDPHLQTFEMQHEPRVALVSAAGGLYDLQLIVRTAGRFLYPGGWLMLEHGCEQGPAVRALFEGCGFKNVETHKDLARHERATVGQWARS